MIITSDGRILNDSMNDVRRMERNLSGWPWRAEMDDSLVTSPVSLENAAERFLVASERESHYEQNRAASVFASAWRREHPDGEPVYRSDLKELAREVLDD